MLLLRCVLWTLLFYSLERLYFLIWNWGLYKTQSFFDISLAFITALRFDFAAISMLSVIPMLLALLLTPWGKNKSVRTFFVVIFILFQLPLMLLNLGDVEFINFLGRRYTFDALFFLREVPGKSLNLALHYWHLSIVNGIFIIGYIYAIFQTRRISGYEEQGLLLAPRKPHKIILSALIVIAIVIGFRGGLQKKPIGFAHAQVFLNPAMNNLLLNTPFVFLQTIKRESLPRDKFFDDQSEMLSYLNGAIKAPSLLEGKRPQTPQNVVLIILESFGLEYTGYPHADKKGYTPFLDQLAGQGLSFTNAFANSRRSIEGIGAIVGGIPAMMNEPFISSQYLTNYFHGIGTLLGKKNYHSSFFHGAANGSMYFDQFMKSAGVQHYYGQNEFPDKTQTDGTWGIWDENMLLWMGEQLGSFPKPFFSAVFTLTSHNPFKLPPQYEGKFDKGTIDIHESIGYTDYSLKKFFEYAKTQSWYENTLFVITADHTYKVSRPEYDNELGRYRVPLIFFHPKFQWPKVDTGEVVQHIDILPSILDFIGNTDAETNYLSRSVFVPGPRTAMLYVDGRYTLVSKDYFLQHHRGGAYDMFEISDLQQKKSLEEPHTEKERLEKTMKATIQYFSQGMWDNKLYYPSGR